MSPSPDVFQGSFELTLDAKGRMTIPAKLRDAFKEAEGAWVTITRHRDPCLMMYTRPRWHEFRDSLDGGLDTVVLQRIFVGNAVDVEIDPTGRVLIPPELRAKAQLKKEVTIRGNRSHFEIWDRERLAESDARDEELLASGALDELMKKVRL